MSRVPIGWAIAASLAVGWVLWITLRADSTLNTTNLVPLREHTQAVPLREHTQAVPLREHTQAVPLREHTQAVPLREHTQAVHCLLQGCPNAARAARFLFIDVAGNVAVFIPIGLALSGALGVIPGSRRLWIAIALSAALSISIELIQLTIPSRATDVDDVLFNTIGAALGATFMVGTKSWFKHNGDG